VDKTARWGDLESDEEEEEEEEEDEEEEEAAGDEALADGLASVASGYSSLPSGIETPEVLDLRKAKAIGGGALAALFWTAGPRRDGRRRVISSFKACDASLEKSWTRRWRSDCGSGLLLADCFSSQNGSCWTTSVREVRKL
jgi:hypothetical protein